MKNSNNQRCDTFNDDLDDSDSDSDVECDQSVIKDIPPRPNSRLDFISTLTSQCHNDDSPPSQPLQKKRTVRWARSSFQRVSVHLNTSTSTSSSDSDDDDDKSPKDDHLALSPPSPSEIIEDIDMDTDLDLDDLSSSTTDDSDSSDSDDLDSKLNLRRFDTPMVRASSPEPESIPVPFPIISDPGHSLPSINPCPPILPLARNIKFSSLPSPFSPHYQPSSPDPSASVIAFKNPLRHHYTHHGHSRHALQRLRCFWSNRRDEWTEYAASAKIHGGMHTAAQSKLGQPGFPNFRTNRPVSPVAPPMTIHPRTGDIAGLRDLYSAHADMCLAGMPMWTMRKLLWMFAVHALTAAQLSSHTVVKPVLEPTPNEPCDSSDVMLVDVDSSSSVETLKGVSTTSDDLNTVTAAVKMCSEVMALSLTSGVIQPAWPLTANARWDFLLRFVRQDFNPPPPPPTPSKMPRFFLGDGDDDDDTGWVDERGRYMDIDDEDDYGVLVANPVFGRESLFDSAICV